MTNSLAANRTVTRDSRENLQMHMHYADLHVHYSPVEYAVSDVRVDTD